MLVSFGNTALQLPFLVDWPWASVSPMTPLAGAWHSNSVEDGIPPRSSSSAGSSVPVSAPSCGSSRKIARGFGRWSDCHRLARFAVMMPPNEKPK